MIAPKTVRQLLGFLIVLLPVAISGCAQGYDTYSTHGSTFASPPNGDHYNRYMGGVETSGQLGPGARVSP